VKIISLRRGQNLVDLALLIGIVGLVVIGMEVYLKRSVQGKVKDLTDYIISDQQKADKDAKDTQSSTTLSSDTTTKESLGGSSSLEVTEVSTYEYGKSKNTTKK
jgi:hypothetical protein